MLEHFQTLSMAEEKGRVFWPFRCETPGAALELSPAWGLPCFFADLDFILSLNLKLCPK